eukprot:COSAG02_NODE_38695_length_426_cov_0.675841_1_plen_69_part_01
MTPSLARFHVPDETMNCQDRLGTNVRQSSRSKRRVAFLFFSFLFWLFLIFSFLFFSFLLLLAGRSNAGI